MSLRVGLADGVTRHVIVLADYASLIRPTGCFAPTPSKPDHVHFMDGADGGYAVAATAMKASP